MTKKLALLYLSLAVSMVCWGQTRLRVPTDLPEQCQGDSCPQPACSGPNCPARFPQPSRGVQQTPPVVYEDGVRRISPDVPPEYDTGRAQRDETQRRLRQPGVIERSLEYPEEPEQRLEFQDFVFHSIGKDLPVYGGNLFERVPTTFAPVDRVPVTADYVIGPGDELLIRAWGQIDLDARVTVDRSGAIYLPRVGNVNVAGLQYEQLQPYLKSAIGRIFKSFDLSVNLGQLRSIQVFVVGQARRPGTYTVSSLSTLVNTLFASGGPSLHGSMRHVQLRRKNEVVTEFDLYDLLLQGDKSKDTVLLPGDVIYIPPVGPLVALSGSVNVPAIYELRGNGDTSLQQAIALAGGLSTTADGERTIIERIDEHRTRRVDEFPLDQSGLQHKMHDGDLVRLLSVSPRFDNAVMLRGNVAEPGRYPWRSGMRIRDLISERTSLITREYWNKQNATAAAVQRSVSSFAEEGQRAAIGQGEIRNEVKRSGPDVNWDYALVQRINLTDLSTILIPFNLGKAIMDGDEQQNIELQPGDVVTIFSQADMPGPLERQTKFVRLEGEFASAGVYRVKPGETLRQLVQRVGLTPQAYLYGAQFTREATRKRQQEGLERMAHELETQVERNAATADRNISAEQAAARTSEVTEQREFVKRLRQVKATGRVVLEFKPGQATANDLPDITLEDGDEFIVPYRPSTVDVLGSVFNANSFFFRPNQSVGYYLRQAGGGTRTADRSQMFVIRADGSVVSSKQTNGLWNRGFADLRIYPGDALVVPERLERGATLKLVKDVTQIISQFALGAAAIRVLQ